MVKAFIGLLVILGLSAGAFFVASPELAKKTFDDMTVNAAKTATDIQEKFNSK